jgi:hypothetical protein
MQPESPKKMSKILIVLVCILALVLVMGGGYYLGTQKKNGSQVVQTTVTSSPSSLATPTPDVSASPVTATLVYTEETDAIETASRRYVVVNIFRKVGDAKPELLATVGKAGEYPSGFILSPDKKTLLINLESKLQSLDLATKALTTVFTPKKQVFDTVFSPDGTRLFIWDQVYAPTNKDYAYFIHDFNLSTKKDTILAQGSNEEIYFPIAWRSDDTVVLGIAKGEFASLASFDLKTKKITATPGDHVSGSISQTGLRMAVTEKTVEDYCFSFGGGSDSTQKIIDPVTAKEFGSVGSSSKRVNILGFSPDDKTVAYSETTPGAVERDCVNEKVADSVYYQASTDGSGTPTVVSKIDALLNSWGLGEYAYESTRDGKSWTIIQQGKTTISSNNLLHVITAY